MARWKMIDMAQLVESVGKTFSKDNPDIVYDPNKVVEFIPSGNFIYDLVSGGGFPRKRITEVFGMEHSGKSSLLYEAFALNQRNGGVGVLFDFEGTFDPTYAKNVFGLEIDNKTFTLFSPDDVEEWDKIFDFVAGIKRAYGKAQLTGNGVDRIDLMGFDSIDAMKPKAIINCALSDDRRIGAQATAVGRCVAKLRIFSKKVNCAVVMTNQMRRVINTSKFEQSTGTGAGFNVMETYNTPGGYAPRFYSSVRMKLEFGSQIKDEIGVNHVTGISEKTRVGHMIKFINVKNKVYTPFLKGLSHFMFTSPNSVGGWSREKDILELLKSRGLVSQRGTKIKFEYGDYKWSNVASAAENVRAFFANEENVKLGIKIIKESMTSDNKVGLLEVASFDELAEIEEEETGRTVSMEDLMEDPEEEEPVDEIKV